MALKLVNGVVAHLRPTPLRVSAATVTEDALLFAIEKYPIEHQGPQVISLMVRLDHALDIGGKEYPDFEEVYTKLIE